MVNSTKNQVISSNHSGGTAQESDDGVLLAKKELSILVIYIRNQRHRLQNIHPLMVQNGAMTSDRVTGNCLLHGGNKSFEWARVRIFGGQGIGFRTFCKCCTFGGN